jgi:hypothetical protein
MEQAVRRTAEYDQELAAKANAAKAAAREGLPVYKEYPEGYRWVELNKPGSFSAESEAMGHSVRGYEPPTGHPDWVEGSGDRGSLNYGLGGWEAIKSGKAKVYSLVDSKGVPHTTVEVGANNNQLRREDLLPYKEAALEEAKKLPNGYTEHDLNDIEIRMARQNMPARINQIKGKSNAAPNQEYLPFVQDFVKSGQWSGIRDIQNAGLVPIDPASDMANRLKEAGKNPPPYVTQNQLTELHDWMRGAGDLPEGYAQGGAVRISNNPDTMRMELGDRHFPVGGAVAATKAGKVGKGFFSAVDRAALGLKRPAGTGKEFMAEIKATKGIKPTELKGRKLDEIAAMPKMTKDQFIKELEARPPVKIEEKVLGQPSQKEIDDLVDKLAYEKGLEEAREFGKYGDDIDAMADENYRLSLKFDQKELQAKAREILNEGGSGPVYERETIPGGQNYREILLKIPTDLEYSTRYQVLNDDGKLVTTVKDEVTANRMIAGKEGFSVKPVQSETTSNVYRSSHWDDPNVLAHIRVSDRMVQPPPKMRYFAVNRKSGFPSQDFATQEELMEHIKTYPPHIQESLVVKQGQVAQPAQKVLHVEEIQSDWHQAGRKARTDEVKRLVKSGMSKQEAQAAVPEDYGYESNMAARRKALDDRYKSGELSLDQYDYLDRELTSVPNAPFKKDWQELALRRVMQEAAEGGYDRVALTPGATQADRYDLSKYVNELHYDSQTKKLTAWDHSGNKVVEEMGVSEDQLPDYIGREGASKLLAQNPQDTHIKQLFGLDLKVGGEGMEGFYDKMLPDYLNKLGKEYGVQVEKSAIPVAPKNSMNVLGFPSGEDYISGRITWPEFLRKNPEAAANFTEPVHGFSVTPQMRQDINEKGLPLYQQIGVPVGTGAVGMEAFDQPAMDDEPVRISDNPDTMRMELEDKQFAVGGFVKAGKAAKKATPISRAPSIIIPSKLGRVKEEVRQNKGEYGARRVERAADEIPNLERLYKEQAFREAFLGDNAKALMTMNPADFQKYAKELRDRSRSDIPHGYAELAKKGEIDKSTVPTDEYIQYLQRVQGGFDDMPYLLINKEEQGLPLMPFISGHEGRHRSRAMAESGEPSSLVQLSPRSELREPFPRRSQEEYIEALRKELEMTDNMVLPEGFERPPIKLPDVYAMGGAVEGENDLGAPSPQNSASPAAGYAIGGVTAANKAAKLAKEAVKPRRLSAKAAESVYAPGVHYADPLQPPTMRMSEALGMSGSEGKTLNFTETDRSGVKGDNRGGVGFSALQHYSDPHKKANASWGFGSEQIAKRKVKQGDPENTVWTTYIGSPEQHKSNTIVVRDALKTIQAADQKGLVHPEQLKIINLRLREATNKKGNPLFPSDFDITDPEALKYATSFERRAAISDVLMGLGVKKPMISKEFKQANPGVQWSDAANIEGILMRETDPALVGLPNYSVGPHLFTMDGGVILQPDLNIAFPAITTGTDFGFRFKPTPIRDAAPDWVKEKGYGPDDVINTRALSMGSPSQFVSEEYLTNLQKSGNKKGGAVKAPNSYKKRASISPLMKHFKTA